MYANLVLMALVAVTQQLGDPHHGGLDCDPRRVLPELECAAVYQPLMPTDVLDVVPVGGFESARFESAHAWKRTWCEFGALAEGMLQRVYSPKNFRRFLDYLGELENGRFEAIIAGSR